MAPNPKRKKPLTEAISPALAFIGIHPPDAHGNQPVSWRSCLLILGMGVYITLSVAFSVFETMTFLLFADWFWITTTAIIMIFTIATLSVKRKNLFDLIDNFEDIIEKRKQHSN